MPVLDVTSVTFFRLEEYLTFLATKKGGIVDLKTVLNVMKNYKIGYCLKQCFSNGVPRRASVPSNYSRCAAESLNIVERMKKKSYFQLFGLFFTLKCVAKLNFLSEIVCRRLKKVENHCYKTSLNTHKNNECYTE
jgi:hypothetical protein